MRYKDGKFHVKKEDLNRRVILIKNHKDQDELESVQAGIIDAAKNVLPIPESSFEKYNSFRVKNDKKPLKIEDVEVYDIDEIKKNREENENLL